MKTEGMGTHKGLTNHSGFAGRALRTSVPLRPTSRCKSHAAYAGIGDDVKKFFDSMAFENWAPRSSRTWRLGKGSGPREEEASAEDQASADEAFVSSLNARISRMGSVRESMQEDEPATLASFEDASDDELAKRFNNRLSDISDSAQDNTAPLTGTRLRELVYAKYGKTYDLSIVKRQVAGMTVVALNVMWTHLDQQSFPMSESQFMDKLDTIAEYLRAWKQEDLVRNTLLEPPRSKRGLPSRPVTGNAVSIRLSLDPSVMAEWFSN